MRKDLKKILLVILLIIIILPFSTQAADSPSINKNTNQYVYTLLAPMPGLLGTSIDTRNGLGAYLNTLYKAGIAIATGLAVLMIVFGGIQYVSSDAINGKSEGKAKIQDALIGLILAFMSYLLLNTLNPDLLKNDLKLENAVLNNASLDPTSLSSNTSKNTYETEQRDEIQRLTSELNNPNTTDERKNEIIKRIEEVSSGINSGSASFINSASSIKRRSVDGGLNISTYGSEYDTTPDSGTRNGYGNNNNQIVPGSVALSPDLISKYKPKPGSSIYINGSFVGYYDDSTGKNTKPDGSGTDIVNTIDIYDPSGVYGKGVLKGIDSNNWQITFGTPRQQIPHN